MMKIVGSLALVVGLSLAFSCGGESDSGDGGEPSDTPDEVDTGLPEDTQLQDVSAEQYSNACETLRADVQSRLGPDIATRGVCEAVGAGLTDEPEQCRTTAEGCVDQVNDGGFMGITREQLDFTSFECGDVGDLEGCSVTVGEFETCLEDQMSALEALMADNNCDNAASVSLADALALTDLGTTAPPSCAQVQQECPGVGPFAEL